MTSPINASLAEGSIALRKSASNWRECFELAGLGLVKSNRAKPEYTAAMIEVFEQLGPYMVIAPGVAIAHAKSSQLVISPGLSLVTLTEGVSFGVERFDPVRVVFGLTAIEHDDHINLLAAMSEFLLDDAKLKTLLELTDEAEARALFG